MSIAKPLVSIVNGKFSFSISTLDRGLAYGDGLFETMRFAENTVPYKDFHFERLMQGIQILSLPVDIERIRLSLNNLLDVAKEKDINSGLIKLILTRGESSRGYKITGDENCNVIVELFESPDISLKFVTEGVDVYRCKHRLSINPMLAGIKHLNKLDYVLACMEWSTLPYQEALLSDTEERVVEACSRNIFIVRNGKILTPLLVAAGVAGVMRRLLIENAFRIFGSLVEETNLSYSDILEAEEIFLTNSVTGIWPVKKIMDRNLMSNFRFSRLAQEWVAQDWQDRIDAKNAL